MNEVHALVDLENNQPTLEDVKKLVPGMTDVWLFHGGQQARHLESYEPLGERRTIVPITRKGPNSLDFHLAFYLGYIASRRPDAKLVVIAIDGGYGPMILHARELGFDVGKVAFTAKAAKSVPTKKAAPAKKTASAKKPAPVKKTATLAKKAPAAKKTPAKKAPVARTAKGLPAKARPAAAKNPLSAPSKVSAAVKEAGRPMLAKAIESLRKMGDKRPRKLKTFQRHMASLLGANASELAVQGLVSSLLSTGAVQAVGDALTYHPPVIDIAT